MNKASSGKNSTVLLLAVLIAALLFAFYYYLVMPKQDEVSSKQNSIATLNQSITNMTELIQVTKETQEKPTTVDLFALRKKVPQTRAVDDLLYNLEQLEFVSGIRIEGIGFNNYDSLVSSSNLTDPNQPATNPDETSTDGSSDGTNSDGSATTDEPTNQEGTEQQDGTVIETPVSTIEPSQLPPALKMLTITIDIQAPSNDAVLAFIKEVESLERVVRVDSISYSLPGEQELNTVKEYKDAIPAQLTITTFYYEGEN